MQFDSLMYVEVPQWNFVHSYFDYKLKKFLFL